MQSLILLLLLLILLGSFALTAVTNALRYLRFSKAKSELKGLGKLFFYRGFHRRLFPKKEFETLFIASLCTRHIMLFLFAALSTGFLIDEAQTSFIPGDPAHPFWGLGWLSLLGFIILSLAVGDFIPRAFASRYPSIALKTCAPVASLYLFICFPITFFFLKLPQTISKSISADSFTRSNSPISDKILEILEDADIGTSVDPNDLKLIESVLSFKDRIVREVMMPRVDVFTLPASMTIREAAHILLDEGYSRVPVYKDTVDHIIGVLMYKDILGIYMQCEGKPVPFPQLDATLETIIKPVFYTPETKKVSQLLQEFRNKQMHMAIVVDEYGGTEGIITIEDILEEIVGDISDEYDDQEEVLYTAQPTGGWIVDARMSILDIEEKFNITIPQDGDYDTLGGYIYHRAGSIPPKGFRIHHDDFELEIISSSDRAIDKVRIIPREIDASEHNEQK